MRINRYVAMATGLSRRAADKLIESGHIKIDGVNVKQGHLVSSEDKVYLDDKPLNLPDSTMVVLMNKPVGYVCSRAGQGNKTIYDILPVEFYRLKPVGRLDKDSSGLLLLTNDGALANRLTHPSFNKTKVYEVELDKVLSEIDHDKIIRGIKLEDGLSSLKLQGSGKNWTVTMTEGRNRQIRRTFGSLGYKLKKLNRIKFGSYKIADMASGHYVII